MFRRFFATVLIIASAATGGMAQQLPQETYINRGFVTNAVVNARNFINEGRFVINGGSVLQAVPWDSQNTINFTNRGTMLANVGFRFETVDPFDPLHGLFGFRHQASNFVNAADSSITGFDGGGLLSFGGTGIAGALFEPDASYININSFNVTNRGNLTVGANGLMQLIGNTVDVSGGTLIVEDVGSPVSSSLGGGFLVGLNGTNFFPAAGVYDLAYGVDLNTNVNPATIVLPRGIITPSFKITNEFSTVSFVSWCETVLFLTNNLQTWMRDERVNATNRVIQVIAVDTVDTNLQVFASFLPLVAPNGTPQGGYLSPIVEFRFAVTNLRTMQPEERSFYVFDQLGSQTNYSLLQNIVADTVRPAPFILFRSDPGFGEFGEPGQPFIPDIFVNPGSGSYSNNIVTNQYAVYSAQIEALANRVPRLPDVGFTNASGRVEINAANLNWGKTRIRGEGLVSINADNFSGGDDIVIDVPHINLDLNTKAKVLDLKDMTPDQVARFGGFIQIYSGIWTNNYAEVSGTGTNAVTNTVETRFELLAIRGSDLHSREPVVAHELRLRSTGDANGTLIFRENLVVTNELEISAPNVTFAENSRLFLGKGVQFAFTNVANVSTFTNLGHIQINELANLSRNENEGFDKFVNRGELIAFGTVITAKYFENTGDIISSNYYASRLGSSNLLFNSDCYGRPPSILVAGMTEGDIVLNADQAKIDGGQFTTLGDMRFSGNVFKFNNHRASVGGRLTLDVRGVLTDDAQVGANRWSVNNGFEMTAVRPAGDLLGTEIRSSAARLAIVDHIWSAEDRGPTVAGFTDNAAIGRLHIEGEDSSLFQFIQTQPGSAMYVDVLEIDGVQAASIRDFTNHVKLQMNVYYGNVESTNGVFTAERLNRILGTNAPFNFYWVSNWAGPYSGVDVPLTENGPVQRFNRALRESANIDSDGDGIPNRYDPFPFPPEFFGITGFAFSSELKTLQFGVMTTEGGNYIVEYTTDLRSEAWTPLKQITQPNPAGGVLSITDQVKTGSPQRYYRVRKSP